MTNGTVNLGDLASRLGVPVVVLFIVLTQMSPRVDRAISIADHADAMLVYIAANGCGPGARPQPMPFDGAPP